MPLPQHIRSATLVVDGRTYTLGNVRITDYGMTADRDAIMGARGMRGMTAPRLTETFTMEGELLESAQVDERDASRAAAYNGTFSNAPPAEPITMATIEAAARSIQRAPVPIGGPVFDSVVRSAQEAIQRDLDRRLETDDVLRARITDHVMGRQATTWANSTLTAATGADLDRVAETYGIERREATPVSDDTQWFIATETAPKKDSPLKRALDALKAPEKTALDCILSDELEDVA